MGMGGEGVTNQEMNTYTAIPIQLLSYIQSKTAKIKGFSGTFCFDLPLSGG